MRPRPGRWGPSPKAAELGRWSCFQSLSVSAFPFHVQLYALSVSSWCPPPCPLLFSPSPRSVRNQLMHFQVYVNRAVPNPELPKLEPEREQLSWSCEANALLASLVFFFYFSRSFLCLNTGCVWVVSMVLQGSLFQHSEQFI